MPADRPSPSRRMRGRTGVVFSLRIESGLKTAQAASSMSATIHAIPSPAMSETPWDQLHRLYFTSYAMWNYLTTPFLLTQPGFECREIEPHQENGETWRCLQVNFPPDIPTHNKEQTFFFNDQGLLQRLDYVAVGPVSHYCFDHTTFGGLVFPTLRRVVRRTPSGPVVSAPTAVLIQIADVAVA